MNKIYITNPVLTSLDAFLNDIWSHKSYGGTKVRTTYSDAECTIEECHPARRSFLDIVTLVNTHFPDKFTQADVAKTIMKVPNMFCFFCGNIKKYVFIKTPFDKAGVYTTNQPHDIDTVDNFNLETFKELLKQ